MKHTPTMFQMNAYQGMFAHFNRALWGGKLPDVVLNFSRGMGKRNLGFFAPERWEHANVKPGQQAPRHEISLNPATLQQRPAIDIASTLVHEMCHLWQQAFGTPSRSGYHNAEWAQAMLDVGLRPTSDGTPEGKLVGQRMTHLIVEGGSFAVAFAALPPEYLLPLTCRPEPEKKKKEAKAKNKVKYVCSEGCGVQAWGKPGLGIICADCEATMVSEIDVDAGEGDDS